MSAPNQLQSSTREHYLDQYKQVVVTMTSVGGTGSGTFDLVFQLHKQGDLVIVDMLGYEQTGTPINYTGYISAVHSIPEEFRPTGHPVDLPCFGINVGGVRLQLLVNINLTGVVEILPVGTLTWVTTSRLGNGHAVYFLN